MTLLAMACGAELITRLVGGKPAAFLYGGSFRDQQTDWDVTYGVTDGNLRVTCGRSPGARTSRRFAVIGDSFAFGQGVPDCQDVVSRLEASVPNADFVNFGLIGAGMESYRLVARDMVGPQFTDVVIIFYGNDVSEIFLDRPLFDVLADSLSAFSLMRKMRRVRAVDDFMRNARSRDPHGHDDDWSFNNIKSSLQYEPDYFLKVAEPSAGSVWLFERAFPKLIDLLASGRPRRKIWIAVVPEATTVSEDVRRFVAGLRGALPRFGAPGSGYEKIRALSQANGVRFIELFTRFLEVGKGLYFVHDLHWSADGHRLAAKLIAEALTEADRESRR